jgi:hypothetical protein
MMKFLEGFDSYGAVSFQSSYKWDNANVVTLGSGRFSGNAAFLGTTTLKKLVGASTGLTAGFSLILPEAGGAFMQWRDNTDSYIMDIGTNPTNSLLFITSSTVAYSSSPIPLNTWIYFEVSILNFSSSAAGNILVRMNGEQIFSSPAGFVLLGSGSGSGFVLNGDGVNTIGYDDLYICDNTGTYNTSFIEDGEILTLFPDGPGAVTDFSLFGAATNWQAVIEQPFDGDTSYVYSGVDTDQDLYTIADMPVGQTIVIPGIAVNTVARKDNTGSIGFIPLAKSGINLGSGTTTPVTSSYLEYQYIFEREPVTNNPWDETLVNSLQIGAEVDI